MKPWRWPLHFQILLGLVLGALIGYAMGVIAVGSIPEGVPQADRPAAALEILHDGNQYWLPWFFDIARLLGDLFLNGLKLIIVPLVTSSIILAIAHLGHSDAFGRLGIKTLIYYGATSLIAVLIGLVLINTFAPGFNAAGQGILEGQDLTAFADAQQDVADKTQGRSAQDFLDVFRAMVPPNVFAAAADNGQLLGLIIVALLIGFYLSRYDKAEHKGTLMRFVEGVYDITIKVTDLVLLLAPIGVIGLLAATVGEQYAKLRPEARFSEFAVGIGEFALVALAALLVHFLVTMPLILAFVARVNPLKHYKAMAPALVTAFSTSSSSSTLPVTMECVEERAGVSRDTASFTLPLGATVNMDGTALYECVAAIFICQCFGLELSFGQQFMVVVVALLTSIGVAGIPSASLVAIVVILNGVQAGLPEGSLPEGVLLVSAMGLLLVFDRPLDMCRTAVNVFSDSVAAATIARSEGEETLLVTPKPAATPPAGEA
ncbi:MAG: dicarboxylate/amino acid:cation symporter [Planctomycetota bacterium]